MAVPFALPDEDDGNAAVEQIFAQIHALLRLLQQQIQSRQTRDEVVVASSRGKECCYCVVVLLLPLDLLLRVQGRTLDVLTYLGYKHIGLFANFHYKRNR